jgi:type I restriction enzyme R subunit
LVTGPTEADFETTIADWLVTNGGYQAVKVGNLQTAPTDFDGVRGIDTAELFAFIGATQADAWSQLIALHGGDADVAQAKFVERLAKVLDDRGTIDVLRNGVEDLGVTIRLAYFRPAHGINPDAAARYAANRPTVTRQLPYHAGSTKTLDLCLFVNGLPVATAELKTHLTGQSAAHAIAQYQRDRDPANVTLARRAVVHFALDTETAWMTTRLAGDHTKFRPFNLGQDHGAGNPPNPDGLRTWYLWQTVWQRDAWLDILHRFVHVEPTKKGLQHTGAVIFPRLHQWDAVLRLAAHAGEHGAGHNYLVQHSAGSGKSNTIAWLAHRLSNLHGVNDLLVFDKVVVITDRVVLDKQLQATVAQFEKVSGVVQKVDESSQQLAGALAGEQARIVITTIQKFPFVLQHVEGLPNRRYAVIADEAHSSQSGEAAKELKKVLGAPAAADTEIELAQAEAAEASLVDELSDPVQDKLAAEVTARGKQPNLSFFAFTATPKARTLELFGSKNPATGKFEPFHLNSMRQAIEEGYILDVLANYTTYETYWNIEKAIADDPAYDPSKARTAIAKYVSLHEHNLAQKADIIINHFRTKVAHQIGGKAKAMVVTASRLHALRYQRALKKYCDEHGIGDVGILAAFSGTLHDGGVDWTESKVNGFGESQTPKRFDSDDYQILVVAEKYQTGFDQPKLHTMYVDKVLSGLAAVQTLSRLNRTHPDKDSTFVLDFRNDAEDIRKAFAPWYVQTVAPPTDPNLLYDAHHALGQFDVLWHEEVEAFVRVLVADPHNTERVHGLLEPAKHRFWHDLDADEQERFRDSLKRFVHTYSYLSQIVPFGDVKLERDYLFCRALAPHIRRPAEAGLDVADKVDLTHLATKVTFEGDISLPADSGEVAPPSALGGAARTPEEALLSEIVATLNERYGTEFTKDHAVRALIDELAGKESVQQAAAANDDEGFRMVIGPHVQAEVLGQFDTAEAFVKKYLDDANYASDLLGAISPLIKSKALVAHQQHCPIGELLYRDEHAWLEYKSTLRTHADTGEIFKPLETACLKSIAGFMNSADGGTLLIGVNDDGEPVGFVSDYASLHKHGHADSDQFQLHLNQQIQNSMGAAAAAANVHTQVHAVDGRDLCRVHVKPSGFPVDATVTVFKNGRNEKKTAFYVRLNNKTAEITDDTEKQKYIAQRWGTG